MFARISLKLGLASLLVLSACGRNENVGAGAATARSGELNLGARGPEVSALQDYLTRYGYFPNESIARQYPRWHPASERAPEPGVFDAATATAVKAYQKNNALPELGYVDAATAARMAQPRCGEPDGIAHFDANDKFDVGTDKWNAAVVTWRLTNTDDVTQPQASAAINQAFTDWAAQSSITFQEVPSTSASMIQLAFTPFATADSPALYGVGGVGTGTLSSGVIAFNTLRTWSVQNPLPGGATDLRTVAAHYIGHVLGLRHSSFSSAVMFPSDIGTTATPLDIDDKMSISALYDQWTELTPSISARDVGVGANGSIWATGGSMADVNGNYGIFQRVGSSWMPSGGGAIRVAVDPNGYPWVIDNQNRIWMRTSNSASSGFWQQMPDSAKDIGIGGDNSVWIVSTIPASGTDFKLRKFNFSTWAWDTASTGGAVRIAVGNDGAPWVVNSLHSIWRRTTNSPTNGSWEALPGLANDIGVGGGNSVGGRYAWAISTIATGNDYRIYTWDEQPAASPGDEPDAGARLKNEWLSMPGAAIGISVGGDGSPVAVDSNLRVYRMQK